MVIFAWFSTQRFRRCFPDHPPAAATVGIAAPVQQLSHLDETTCLRQLKAGMNGTGRRALDGCPMFAPAYVGRKRWAKPFKRFYSIERTVVR